MVQTTPSSIRILDVAPHNHFTVTCTATAVVEGNTVPLEMAVEWRRRSQPPVGSTSFTDVPSDQYVTSGSPENGYQSVLTTSETDTENIISYRCVASLVTESSVFGVSTSYVEVIGM